MVTFQESVQSKAETPETCRTCYPPSRATTIQSDSLEACPVSMGTEAEGKVELHF